MTLAPFDSVDRSALRWLRPTPDDSTFTLFSGDQAIATLTRERSSGSLARAGTSSGQWTLKRVGFLNPHLTLRIAGESKDSARISLHADPVMSPEGEIYHRIEFAGGAQFRLHRAGIQTPAWKVSTADRAEVAHIEPMRDGRKLTGAAVIVTARGVGSPELAPLLAFAWYFIVLAWFEDEILLPLERVLTELELR